MFKIFLKYEKLNSKIKLSNNSSLVILIFVILKFPGLWYIKKVVGMFQNLHIGPFVKIIQKLINYNSDLLLFN